MDQEFIPVDPLDQEEIEFARSMSPGDKMKLGLDLFDRACKYMLIGIRHEFPEIDDAQALEILRERLLERWENRGAYVTIEPGQEGVR